MELLLFGGYMRLTVMDKKSIAKAYAMEYIKATKSEKIFLLYEFTKLTGYNRNYAATLLRTYPEKKKIRKKYNRKPYYDDQVKVVLEEIWSIMDFICGQRLAPILPELIERLVSFNEIKTRLFRYRMAE